MVGFDSMTSDPRVQVGGGARGQEVNHHLMQVCMSSYLDKAFVPDVPCRGCFHSMTADPRAHALYGARGQNLVKLKNGIFALID